MEEGTGIESEVTLEISHASSKATAHFARNSQDRAAAMLPVKDGCFQRSPGGRREASLIDTGAEAKSLPNGDGLMRFLFSLLSGELRDGVCVTY